MTNTALGFFGLGIFSVTSLIIAHQVKPFTAPPILEVVSTPAPTVKESIERLIKAGYKGCANLTNSLVKGTLFYVCVKTEKDGSNLPFFFYNDKTSVKSFPQISQVKVKSSSSRQPEFQLFFSENKGEKTVKLLYYPSWFKNLKDPEGRLEKSCELEKTSSSTISSTFTLKCNDRIVQRNIQI